MNCPYCNKNIEIDDRVISNTENYGGSTFVSRCNKCNNIVEVVTERRVEICFIEKSNKKISDLSFGY